LELDLSESERFIGPSVANGDEVAEEALSLESSDDPFLHAAVRISKTLKPIDLNFDWIRTTSATPC
jgi:hypothetical protein